MQEISVHQFKELLQRPQSHDDYINVCEPGEYAEQHIDGVRNVPLSDLESHLQEFADKEHIYVHCQSGRRGAKAIEQLQQAGITANCINVSGGLMAWSEAGLPTNSHTTRLPIMRQVLIAAGSLVLIGALGALVSHPAFIYLALFVGLGLLFAGITGWCGMAFLLGKMPWNQ
jgi:rhodanese-related sulfurtransferase